MKGLKLIVIICLISFNILSCSDKKDQKITLSASSFYEILNKTSYLDDIEATVFIAAASDIAALENARLKSRFFEMGAIKLGSLRETLLPNCSAGGALNELSDALTKVLNSDVVGIVTELQSGQAGITSRSGRGLSLYITEMLRRNHLKQIIKIVDLLKKGNYLRSNPSKFLKEYSIDHQGKQNYQNLINLGYVIGVIVGRADDFKIKINSSFFKAETGDSITNYDTELNFMDAIVKFAMPDDMNGSHWSPIFYSNIWRFKKID